MYTEYFNLWNFRRYHKFKQQGMVDWPWNIGERGHIPSCLERPLNDFIDKQYEKQKKEWHTEKYEQLSHVPDFRKKWKEMNEEQIESHFAKMIDVENKQRKGGELKERKAYDERVGIYIDYTNKPDWFVN